MCVSDCAEGKRLLEAATQPNPGSVAREAFLEHIKNCPVCNAGGARKSEQQKGPRTLRGLDST
jgi:hypothetical protein